MGVGELWDLVVGAVLARVYKMLSLLRLRPNMNRMTHNVWVGGANSSHLIVDEGFDAVVDLRKKKDDKYTARLRKSGIECLNRPIPDGAGLPPRDLLETAEWIAARVRTGAKVLVHCDLGRGRAALVAISYLVYNGLDPRTAFILVKENRRITYLNRQQRDALHTFAETLPRHKC